MQSKSLAFTTILILVILGYIFYNKNKTHKIITTTNNTAISPVKIIQEPNAIDKVPSYITNDSIHYVQQKNNFLNLKQLYKYKYLN